MDSLLYFDLSHNRINSTIPESWVELLHMENIDLSGNLLQGRLPLLPTLSPSPSSVVRCSGLFPAGEFSFILT